MGCTGTSLLATSLMQQNEDSVGKPVRCGPCGSGRYARVQVGIWGSLFAPHLCSIPAGCNPNKASACIAVVELEPQNRTRLFLCSHVFLTTFASHVTNANLCQMASKPSMWASISARAPPMTVCRKLPLSLRHVCIKSAPAPWIGPLIGEVSGQCRLRNE